jgi:hypothetical protein
MIVSNNLKGRLRGTYRLINQIGEGIKDHARVLKTHFLEVTKDLKVVSSETCKSVEIPVISCHDDQSSVIR